MVKVEAKNEDDGAVNYFESSIESLFGHHQAASGEPGQRYSLHLSSNDNGDGEQAGAITLDYRIPASKTNRLFAHYQWDAGLFLCQLVYRESDVDAEVNVRGKSVLELGAGTGLPGIISAKHGGASSVLITDYPDEGILAALRENVSLAKVNSVASVEGLDWADNDALQHIKTRYPAKFDRLLCADLLWLSSSHLPLLNTIHNLLSTSTSSRCITVSGFHTGRRALSHFFRKATTTAVTIDGVQRRLTTSTDRKGLPCVVEYNVVEKVFRPWSGNTPFPGVTESVAEPETEDSMDDYTERTKWLLYVVLQWADL